MMVYFIVLLTSLGHFDIHNFACVVRRLKKEISKAMFGSRPETFGTLSGKGYSRDV